jgi:hypothetical protein
MMIAALAWNLVVALALGVFAWAATLAFNAFLVFDTPRGPIRRRGPRPR